MNRAGIVCLLILFLLIGVFVTLSTMWLIDTYDVDFSVSKQRHVTSYRIHEVPMYTTVFEEVTNTVEKQYDVRETLDRANLLLVE